MKKPHCAFQWSLTVKVAHVFTFMWSENDPRRANKAMWKEVSFPAQRVVKD